MTSAFKTPPFSAELLLNKLLLLNSKFSFLNAQSVNANINYSSMLSMIVYEDAISYIYIWSVVV